MYPFSHLDKKCIKIEYASNNKFSFRLFFFQDLRRKIQGGSENKKT